MGRNPRPCVCGHRRDDHRRPHDGLLPCWYGQIDFIDFGCQCPAYRPARRTEPLRARRVQGRISASTFVDCTSDIILRHVRQQDTASGAVR
jgi:hypothetical protein